MIWVIGLVVRFGLMFGLHGYGFHRPEAIKVALSLAQTARFADPYAIPTGFTAHLSPAYPALIAPIYRFLGDTQSADFARMGLSVTASAGGYALLPVVSEAIGIGTPPGLVAGLVGALLPSHYYPETTGETEAAFVPGALELCLIGFARLWRRRAFGLSSGTLLGLGCGLSTLFSASLMPVYVGWVALSAVRFGARSWRLVVGVLLGIVLATAPWTARNYVRLGGLFFVRDNFGLELYLSNHDGAIPALEVNDRTPFWTREQPLFSPEVAREVLQQGEWNFERERLRRAMDWIRTHPAGFASLTAARAWNFWFNSALPAAQRILLSALTVVAFLGWAVLFRKDRWAAAVLGSILLTYPLVYYIIESGMRYEYPVYWVKLLLAGIVAVELWRHFRLRFNWTRRRDAASLSSSRSRGSAVSAGSRARVGSGTTHPRRRDYHQQVIAWQRIPIASNSTARPAIGESG